MRISTFYFIVFFLSLGFAQTHFIFSLDRKNEAKKVKTMFASLKKLSLKAKILELASLRQKGFFTLSSLVFWFTEQGQFFNKKTRFITLSYRTKNKE